MSQLGRGAGGATGALWVDARCCSTSYDAPRAPALQDSLGQNVNSGKAENPALGRTCPQSDRREESFSVNR